MLWIDWALLAVLVVSALLGVWRGLVYEVLSVAAWVAAFVLAQAYASQAAAWLPLQDLSVPLQLAAGFSLVFMAAAFVGGLLAWLVKRVVDSVGLRPVDRVLGAAFGLLRGLLILLALTVVVSMTPLHQQGGWQTSQGAGVLAVTLNHIKPMLPTAVARYLP
jgi:membrane protein required for colicin V production